MIDPATDTVQDIKAIGKERHIGSPASIIILTGEQRQLWRENRLLLLADYSIGLAFYLY